MCAGQLLSCNVFMSGFGSAAACVSAVACSVACVPNARFQSHCLMLFQVCFVFDFGWWAVFGLFRWFSSFGVVFVLSKTTRNKCLAS